MGPGLRQLLARRDFQGTSVGAHGLGQNLGALFVPSVRAAWVQSVTPTSAVALTPFKGVSERLRRGSLLP
jgi:hypothetical protein